MSLRQHTQKKSAARALKNPGIVFADISSNNFGILKKGAADIYRPEVYCNTHPFLVIKATQGLTYVDPIFVDCVNLTHAHRRAVGFYHYMSPWSDNVQAMDEAHYFAEIVRPHLQAAPHLFGHPDDFVILDIETTQADPQECINAFCDTLHALLKVTVICYTGLAYFSEHGLTCPSGRWWIAAYPGPVPRRLPRKQILWGHQYTEAGKVRGIAGSCDKSILINQQAIRYWT